MTEFDYNKFIANFDFNRIVRENPSKKPTSPLYIVQYEIPKGKGWHSVAKKFLISKKDLIKNNPKLAQYIENEKLSIPAGSKFNVPGHKAQKGDTVSTIAAKYGMTQKEFLELNNMTNKNTTIIKDKVYYVYATPSEAFKKGTKPLPQTKPAVTAKPSLASTEEIKPAQTTKVETTQILSSTEIDKKVKTVKTKSDVSKVTGISQNFIEKLTSFEGVLRLLSEDPKGRPVVGIGHDLACRDASELKKYRRLKQRGIQLTDTQIYQLLARDILEAKNALQETLGKNYSKLTQPQQEALIDLVFNVGGEGFKKSKKLIKHINEGCKQQTKNPKEATASFYDAANEFDHRHSGGAVLPGLCKRRINDMMLFTNSKPAKMPQHVLDKLYETYTKGLTAAQKRSEYLRETNELMGCQLFKNKNGKIETIPLGKPVSFEKNRKSGVIDVIPK